MPSATNLQVELLQNILQSHQDEWCNHLKNCQPIITFSAQPPSFMKFLGSNFDGSFVVLSSNVITTDDAPSSSNVMDVDSGEVVIPCGLEIEGTPLEAPFTQEEMEMLNAKLTTLNLNFFPLDKFSPLPIAFARNVLMWYNMALTSFCKVKTIQEKQLAPLIIICKKENKMPISSCLLGVGSLKSLHNTTINAKILGQLPQDEIASHRTEFFNSLTPTRKPGLPESKITSAVLKAEYLQQTLHLSASGSKKNVKADCFLVQILWKNPRNFNCEIPVPQSLGTISSLEITLQDNYDQWETGKIWEEVKLLQELCRLHCLDKPDVDLYLPAVSGDTPPKSIDELLNRVNFQPAEGYDLNTLEGVFQFINDGKRPCSDLTDAMWNIFKYNTNAANISNGIERVLKHCVSNYYDVQPSNTSEIGQLARELYTSKDATLINAPSFQKTLFYMLEIGFLKLQRDFSFAAMSSQIMVSTSILKALDCPDWTQKISRLAQVHQAFEVVLRAKKWLHLEQDSLHHLFVKSLEVPLLEKIATEIPFVQLGHIVKCYQPVIRSWQFQVLQGTSTISHNFLASQYPIFSWAENCKKDQDDMDVSLDSKKLKPTFYCAILSEQSRNLKRY